MSNIEYEVGGGRDTFSRIDVDALVSWMLILFLLGACGSHTEGGRGMEEGHRGPLSPQTWPRADTTIAGLEYRVSTMLVGSIVEARVSLRNPATDTIRMAIPGCSRWLRAYETPARADQPAWDEKGRLGWNEEIGAVIACTAQEENLVLGPGQSRSHEIRYSVDAILGDSLPEGRYYMSVLIESHGQPVAIPAGSVELMRPRTSP